MRVRLETRSRLGVHLDLHVTDPVDGTSVAIELKYLADVWEGNVGGEAFHLLRQSAQDIRSYDCVKDIVACAVGPNRLRKIVLVLANEPSYWRGPEHGRLTNACVQIARRAGAGWRARMGARHRAGHQQGSRERDRAPGEGTH